MQKSPDTVSCEDLDIQLYLYTRSFRGLRYVFGVILSPDINWVDDRYTESPLGKQAEDFRGVNGTRSSAQ
jgi:hypothetical protein